MTNIPIHQLYDLTNQAARGNAAASKIGELEVEVGVSKERIEALELEVSRLKCALDAVITALEVKKSKP